MDDGWRLAPFEQGERVPLARFRRRRVGGWTQLPSGKWRFRVRGHHPDGAVFLLDRITGDATQRELIESEARKEASLLKSGLTRSLEVITLGEYKRRYERRFPFTPERESTWRFLKPFWRVVLQAITAALVSSWSQRVTYKAPGRPPAGQAHPGYVRHSYELLHRLLRQAYEDSSDPSKRPVLLIMPFHRKPPGIPASKAAYRERIPFTPAEKEAILSAAQKTDPLVFFLIRLLFQTGLRPIELCRARFEDLSDGHRAFAVAPVGSGALRCAPCKKGKAHTVALPADLYRELLTYWQSLPRAAQATGWLFPVLSKRRWRERRRYLFSQKKWQKIRALSGIRHEPWFAGVLYQTRHTRIDDLVNDRRTGARRAAELMGHTDQRTTEGYARPPGDFDASIFDSTCLPAGPIPINSDREDRETPPRKPGKKSRKKPHKTACVRGHIVKTARVSPKNKPRVSSQGRVPVVAAQGENIIGLGHILTALRLHGPGTVARHMIAELGALDSYRHAKEIREALPGSGMPPEIFEPFLVLLEKLSAKEGLVSPALETERKPAIMRGLVAVNEGDASCFTRNNSSKEGGRKDE